MCVCRYDRRILALLCFGGGRVGRVLFIWGSRRHDKNGAERERERDRMARVSVCAKKRGSGVVADNQISRRFCCLCWVTAACVMRTPFCRLSSARVRPTPLAKRRPHSYIHYYVQSHRKLTFHRARWMEESPVSRRAGEIRCVQSLTLMHCIVAQHPAPLQYHTYQQRYKTKSFTTRHQSSLISVA